MSSGYKFETREQLKTAVSGFWTFQSGSYKPSPTAIETYGDINTWDVSSITDFSRLFLKKWIF